MYSQPGRIIRNHKPTISPYAHTDTQQQKKVRIIRRVPESDVNQKASMKRSGCRRSSYSGQMRHAQAANNRTNSDAAGRRLGACALWLNYSLSRVLVCAQLVLLATHLIPAIVLVSPLPAWQSCLLIVRFRLHYGQVVLFTELRNKEQLPYRNAQRPHPEPARNLQSRLDLHMW